MCLCLTCFIGRVQNDSLLIQTNFELALQNQNIADSLIADANIVASKSNSFGVKDYFEYQNARYLFITGSLDSAYACSKKALESIPPSNFQTSAKYFNLLGSIKGMKGDYERAVDLMLRAVKIYDYHGNTYRSALIENNIANIFFSLKDYESAYDHAYISYQTLKDQSDTINISAVTGVLAVSAIKRGDTENGSKLTQEALALSMKYNNPVGLIIAYYAQGELLQKEKDWEAAIESYRASKVLSTKLNHVHYTLLNNIALLHAYTEVADYEKAIAYGLEAIEQSTSQKNDNTYYSISKQLGYAYAGKREYQKAYQFLNEALSAYIKTAGIESRETINEMLIKYETQKKETEIAEQKVLILQKQKSVDDRNSWIIILLSVLILSVLIFLVIRYSIQKRVQRLKFLQQEKVTRTAIQAEETERERISNELHDGIAAAITGAKIQLELLDEKHQFDFDKLLANLSEIHADVRNISHNLMPVNFESKSLPEVVNNHCERLNSAQLKINFYNNIQNDFKLSESTSSIVYRAVQELIQNVVKHADAKNCTVQFNLLEQYLIVSVEDDGNGFSSIDQNGQGLKSIERRLQNIGGEFKVESNKEDGTLCVLSIPIER